MTNTWEFENYTIVDEQEILRFENKDGDTIGYVAAHDHYEEMVNDLNNGTDPIADGWEDGVGNTITLDGWGEFAE